MVRLVVEFLKRSLCEFVCSWKAEAPLTSLWIVDADCRNLRMVFQGVDADGNLRSISDIFLFRFDPRNLGYKIFIVLAFNLLGDELVDLGAESCRPVIIAVLEKSFTALSV